MGSPKEIQEVIEVVEITDLNEVIALKDNWELVYHNDPQCDFYTSWVWLRSYFESTRYEWVVLAAREQPAQDYVAFLPLVIQRSSFGLIKTIHLGGFPIADYSGFVCLPGYESVAIRSISEAIKEKLTWDRFRLGDVLGERLQTLLEHFPADKFLFDEISSTPCPYIHLPGSFDEYIASLGSGTRRAIRRTDRNLQKAGDTRVSDANENDVDVHIDILLNLWRGKWGLEPDGFRPLFQRCFENDCLQLQVLWLSDKPIAALLAYVDNISKTYLGFLFAYDANYQKLSPGRVLLVQSIEYAIEQGIETYDFLRGGEAYKYAYGGVDRFSHSTCIMRKNVKNVAIGSMKKIIKNFNN